MDLGFRIREFESSFCLFPSLSLCDDFVGWYTVVAGWKRSLV